MKKNVFLLLVAYLISLSLYANEYRSIKVIINLNNGNEITGHILNPFPDNFKYTENKISKYLRNINGQVYIVNEVLIESNGFILRFMEKNSLKTISPAEIKSVKLISKYNKPVPSRLSDITKEEFDVLSKNLVSSYYITPDKVSKDIAEGYLILSFNPYVDLKEYVDNALLEISKLKDVKIILAKFRTIKKELIKQNIFVYQISSMTIANQKQIQTK